MVVAQRTRWGDKFGCCSNLRILDPVGGQVFVGRPGGGTSFDLDQPFQCSPPFGLFRSSGWQDVAGRPPSSKTRWANPTLANPEPPRAASPWGSGLVLVAFAHQVLDDGGRPATSCPPMGGQGLGWLDLSIKLWMVEGDQLNLASPWRVRGGDGPMQS